MAEPKPSRIEAEPTPLFSEGELVLERHEMAADFIRRAQRQLKRGNPAKAHILSIMAAEADPYPFTEMAELTRAVSVSRRRQEMRRPIPSQIVQVQEAVHAHFPDPGDHLDAIGEAQATYTEEQVELPLATGMLGAFLADHPDSTHRQALELRRQAFSTSVEFLAAHRHAELEKDPSVAQVARVELIERLTRKTAVVGINGVRSILRHHSGSASRLLRGEREMLQTCLGALEYGGWAAFDFHALRDRIRAGESLTSPDAPAATPEETLDDETVEWFRSAERLLNQANHATVIQEDKDLWKALSFGSGLLRQGARIRRGSGPLERAARSMTEAHAALLEEQDTPHPEDLPADQQEVIRQMAEAAAERRRERHLAPVGSAG